MKIWGSHHEGQTHDVKKGQTHDVKEDQTHSIVAMVEHAFMNEKLRCIQHSTPTHQRT